MTQAAVSYQIKLLEERVGAPLFLRAAAAGGTHRSGRQLATGVTEAFDRLRLAFGRLHDEVEGVLTVSASAAFATKWLASRIGAFQLRHPSIAVRLSTTQRVVDFEQEEVDVALRAGLGPWPGLVGHRLLPLRFTPVAAPTCSAVSARSTRRRICCDCHC